MSNAGVRTLPRDSKKRAGGKEKREADTRIKALHFHRVASGHRPQGLEPGPTETSPWRAMGRPLYRNTVSSLKDAVKKTNLMDPGEFHALLFMAVGLGAEQIAVAQAQHVSKAMVSRWVRGRQTPEPERRRGILRSAIEALDAAIEKETLPTVMEFTGKRAYIP